MAETPVTSVTLLKDLASDPEHVRWGEFVARYRPMMEAFLRRAFPFVEPDDIIQETLLTLVAKLPEYRYVPEETGHFRNYLTGILRHKALRVCTRDKRRGEVMEMYRRESQSSGKMETCDESAWRNSIYEIALEQVLADGTIQGRTKQIFVRTAINGERPEDVAESLGITRNSVDQAKNRMVEKMRSIVVQLESVDVDVG